MKHLGEMLLSREPVSEIVMGNTALVRAMVEAGTRVVTSYPGSPTPEIAAAIRSIPPDRRPFYFEFSTNEKVATEVAYGAAVNGHLSTVFFKSVGLNVAADTFVQLSLMNIIGGMVVVLGDDPGANSSQNEQDNRHYARMAYTPVLEPADPEGVYHHYLEAARLSVERAMPVILRLTTHVCHAKTRVQFNPWTPSDPDAEVVSRFDPENGPYIPIAAEVFPMKRRALERLEAVREWAEASSLNRVIDHGHPRRGIITSGLPFLSLMDVIAKADDPPDVLTLGVVHPLPTRPVVGFLEAHADVLVLEELDDVLEREIKALAFDHRIGVRIHGKVDLESWVGEYTPDKVEGILRATWPDLLPEAAPRKAIRTPPPPARPAQMCPGCGHRSAFHAIRKALKADDITVADIGCHTLGFLPPYRVGRLLLCMGASTGIGSGLSLNNPDRRVVAFLGDSTFFHAGLPGIVNAVFQNHRLTLILMENGTTAMTGHQDHPASVRRGQDPAGRIPVRRVLEGLGVTNIFECDTYQQSRLKEMIESAMAVDGFSVVIARHPCMLKFTRQQRKKPDHVDRRVSVDPTRCRRIHACVAEFGCPTFVRHDDGQVSIQPDLCIGDGSCIQTCPASAIRPPEPVSTAEGDIR